MSILDNEPVRKDSQKSAINNGRSVKFSWHKAEDFYAYLSVHHHAERKEFFATLNVERRKERSVESRPFDGVTILREPCARYSVKAREAFIERALERLRENADEPKVAAIAAETPAWADTLRV